MSPEELDSLANDIQDNLKKDLVLVKGFHSQSMRDVRGSKKLLVFKIICFLNIARLFILSFLCLFPSSKTSRNFKVIFVDTFFAFGSFGCLFNQILLLGFTYALNFSHVMHEAEKNGQLKVISHIKDHRKFRLTPVETIKFARYLKWIKNMRPLYIYVILPPIVFFFTVGSCISSLELESVTFTVASIFVTLINCTHMYFICVWAHYAIMMPVHSNNVLSILFNRIFEKIKNLQRTHDFIDGRLMLDSETRKKELSVKLHHWVKRAKRRVKKRQSILKTIENVLRQTELHNQTVKHILDKAISCVIPEIGLVIVFFGSEQGDLMRHMFSAAAGLASLIFYVSLLKTRDVYTLSLRLSSNLHGIQARERGKGMKSQLKILRLIQRTSDCESWHHSIGFTVGSRGSLSPKLVLYSFFQIMTIALTFLNARSAWTQH